ncbi:hypothetical protein [Epilithonimonas vandammei]|uniref:hypothetical protein n=1 Tax=Epilithonimonas vandammei TaxID=2487072 RepID=UPI001E59D134|nr:hypothetical protein [Epilithonimonas vandammei]
MITLFCLGFFLIPFQSYACSKKSTSTEKNPAQKKNLKNCTTKTVASTSQIKNVTMVTTAMAIVNTALADAVLLHLLSAY